MTAARHVYVSSDLLTRLTKNQRVGAFEHFNDFSGYWLKSESTDSLLIERPDYDPDSASSENMTDEEVMALLWNPS